MATMSGARTKFILDEDRIPGAWYNIAADLPTPAPPVLHPGTGQPIGPADLAPLFPMELIKQVVSQDREIEIPEPIRDAYRLYRPSPLFRPHRLEKALDTPARSGSRSARRSRIPSRTRVRSTRSARCSTSCCCTRP